MDGREVEFPIEGVFLGAFSVNALYKLNVWKKLCTADLHLNPSSIFFINNDDQLTQLISAVPRSGFGSTFYAFGGEGWQATIAPASKDEVFAILYNDQVVRLAMLGLPTEDAWEEFSRAYEDVTGSIRQPDSSEAP